MLHEQDLDAYSKFAVPIILARFPDWQPFAKFAPWFDGSAHFVNFNVPSPNPAVEFGLWVSTADEELTVGFHTHHRHFTNYNNRTEQGLIDAGLEYAADILEERIGVLSYYGGDRFCGSVSIEVPHSDPFPNLHAGIGTTGKLADLMHGWDRITLRTWTGRFDRDEDRRTKAAR
jgi:hypothetical protein